MHLESVLVHNLKMVDWLRNRSDTSGIEWDCVVRRAKLSRSQKTRVRRGDEVGMHTVQELARALTVQIGGRRYDQAV